MKTRILATLAVLVALTSASAHATCKNGATNYPQCNNQPTPTPAPPTTPVNNSNVSSSSQANSNATSGAWASQGQNQHQGQHQGQGQSQSVSGSGNSDVTVGLTEGSTSSSYKNSMWVLPAPVFTPPLPMIQSCPGANVDQHATAVGWNFLSHARATVNTDNCTAITLYNSYVSTCKYKSAQQVLDLLTKKILPDFERSGVPLSDLSKKDCDELLKPVAVQPPQPYIQTEAPQAPCAKGQRRNSKGVCYTPKVRAAQKCSSTAPRVLMCSPVN